MSTICLLLPSDFKWFSSKPRNTELVLVLMGKTLPFQSLCLHVYSKQALWGKKWDLKNWSLFHSAAAHGRFAAQFLLTMIFFLMISRSSMLSLNEAENGMSSSQWPFMEEHLSWWDLLVQENAWNYNSSHIHSGAKNWGGSATKLPFNSGFFFPLVRMRMACGRGVGCVSSQSKLS